MCLVFGAESLLSSVLTVGGAVLDAPRPSLSGLVGFNACHYAFSLLARAERTPRATTPNPLGFAIPNLAFGAALLPWVWVGLLFDGGAWAVVVPLFDFFCVP